MESSLALSLTELRQYVGFYLGYGRGPDAGDTAWSAAQLWSIDSCIKSGLRQFYRPPLLPGEREVHEWSFLRPVATLTLVSGDSTLDLPDDFAGVEGQLAVNQDTGTLGSMLSFTSPSALMSLYQTQPTATGRPLAVCVEPVKGTTANRGQRSQLRVWPTADQEYTLSVQYYLLPNALSDTNPYPLGGAQHAETIKQSCLAVAEKELDDSLTVNNTMYLQQLAASIAADRKSKPQNLGYNGDGSDDLLGLVFQSRVTVNGVQY